MESSGLIAASIMAKKVASGTSALVLDLKVGRGAFAADLEKAREIGRLCRLIGTAYGRPTTCLYTAMDAPLGRTVGNRLEVEEAWQVLKGEGPADVREVTLAVAAELLPLADLGLEAAEARARAEAALADGRAAGHFERWCYVQGGRWQPGEFHRLAAHEVKAPAAGYVTAVDALAVGAPPSWPGPAAAPWTTPSTRRRVSCSSGRSATQSRLASPWRPCLRDPRDAGRRAPSSRPRSP